MFLKIVCGLVPSDNEETGRTGTDISGLVVEEIGKTSLLMCLLLDRKLSGTTNCYGISTAWVILWYAINDSNIPLMMVFRKTDSQWMFITRTKKAVVLWEVSLLLTWRCKEVWNEEAIDIITDFEFCEHFSTGSGSKATNNFHLIFSSYPSIILPHVIWKPSNF